MNINTNLQSADFTRVTDYWLGGSYHTEADRMAADAMSEQVPELPALMRTILRVQQGLIMDWRGKGINQFLVIGANMPDRCAFHTFSPSLRILYMNDNPQAVKYGREMLNGTPNAHYEWLDGLNLGLLRSMIQLYFKPGPMGVLAMNTLFYIPSEVHTYMSLLNQFVDPLSRAVCLFYRQPNDPGERAGQAHFIRQYASIGLNVFPVNENMIPALVHPWQLAMRLNLINGFAENIEFHLRNVLPPLEGALLPPAVPGPLVAILKK